LGDNVESRVGQAKREENRKPAQRRLDPAEAAQLPGAKSGLILHESSPKTAGEIHGITIHIHRLDSLYP
jgi:hypothetical protein